MISAWLMIPAALAGGTIGFVLAALLAAAHKGEEGHP